MMDSQEKALEMGNQEEVAGMEVQEAQAAVEETLPAGQEAQDAGPEAQGEAAQDAEGLQTMRTLADNMARTLFDMRDGGRTAPVREPRVVTSFIR